MNRFQKALFTLAAVVALATTASAQVTFFVSTSGARPVRSEGLAEATGSVAFAANSGGTIRAGSTISLDFGTGVLPLSANVSNGCAALATGAVGTVAIATAGAGYTVAPPTPTTTTGGTGLGATVSVTIVAGAVATVTLVNGGAGYTAGDTLTVSGGTFTTAATLTVTALAAAGPSGGLTKGGLGNVLTLTVTGLDRTCVPGNSIIVSGTRVNANALGAGVNVNVTTSANVPALFSTVNAVTLVQFPPLTVASVQAAPSTSSKLTPSGGGSILFCTVAANGLPGNQQVTIEITEKFTQAFLSQAQENALAKDGLGANPAQFRLRYTITGIPVGVVVTPVIAAGTSASLTFNTVPFDPPTYTGASGSPDNDFDLQINATNDNAIETVVVTFNMTVPDISDAAFPKVEATATLRVLLRGSTDSPEAPRFSTAASARQFDGAIFRTLACASYLLFPWVAYTGDGAVDTGLAIANTTADPAVIGTPNQKGDVTLHFWRAGGPPNPAPVKIATALDAGKSATYVISQLGAPFQGYVIAVCTFQMGHGISAFLSGGSFNAFLAISLNNPRLSGLAVQELSGH